MQIREKTEAMAWRSTDLRGRKRQNLEKDASYIFDRLSWKMHIPETIPESPIGDEHWNHGSTMKVAYLHVHRQTAIETTLKPAGRKVYSLGSLGNTE